MSEVPIVILSAGRAGRVKSIEAVEPVKIVVPDRDGEAYRRAYRDIEIVTTPPEVRGLAPARNWCLDTWGDLLMLDDDLPLFKQLLDPDRPERLRPRIAYDVVQQTAEMAREVGAYLWGFANIGDNRNYHPHTPFRTTGFVQGLAMGIMAGTPGCRLRFPDHPAALGHDYYLSALNAYYHRFIWCDTRFGFWQAGTFRARGGLSRVRTLDNEEKWARWLQEQFGSDAIRIRKSSSKSRGNGIVIRSMHPFQKELHVPW